MENSRSIGGAEHGSNVEGAADIIQEDLQVEKAVHPDVIGNLLVRIGCRNQTGICAAARADGAVPVHFKSWKPELTVRANALPEMDLCGSHHTFWQDIPDVRFTDANVPSGFYPKSHKSRVTIRFPGIWRKKCPIHLTVFNPDA